MSTITGADLTPTKASIPKRSNTPASIAEAIATGIRFISRSNSRVAPARTISTAQTTKAPIACAIVNPATPVALVAISAAPGVDQAATTGFL